MNTPLHSIRSLSFFVFVSIVLATFEHLGAQTATVQGIITDQLTGEALEGANIALQEIDRPGVRGMSADNNGFYQITGLPPGEYALRISFVGYVLYNDTLDLVPGEILTVSRAMEQEDSTPCFLKVSTLNLPILELVIPVVRRWLCEPMIVAGWMRVRMI